MRRHRYAQTRDDTKKNAASVPDAMKMSVPLSAANAAVLGRRCSICVVGAGTSGIAWTALFLAHGLSVVVSGPPCESDAAMQATRRGIASALAALGLSRKDATSNLCFDADLQRAVAGADLVLENGPERIGWKQQLWERVERAAPRHALLLSLSPSYPAGEQAAGMRDAHRLLVIHPFPEPHLVPLVAVLPGEHADAEVVRETVAFCAALGQVPRVLRDGQPGFGADAFVHAIDMNHPPPLFP